MIIINPNYISEELTPNEPPTINQIMPIIPDLAVTPIAIPRVTDENRGYINLTPDLPAQQDINIRSAEQSPSTIAAKIALATQVAQNEHILDADELIDYQKEQEKIRRTEVDQNTGYFGRLVEFIYKTIYKN